MDILNNWQDNTKHQRQQILSELVAGKDISLAHNCINLVSAGHYGVYASMGPNFAYAIFGRDSLEVAEHLLNSHKPLVRNIIFTLARLQGVKNDDISEEEPGKIHHEYRSRVFDGERISEQSLSVMHKLQHWWGAIGTDELVYYGSFDATPMYIKLVCEYIKVYGKDILNETYIARDGHSKTILDCLHAATNWLTTKISASSWHLLEYKRINPNGILNQVWKDSNTSYLHVDGSVANAEHGIASVELQAYAYDALMLIAEHETLETAKKHRAVAKELQQATLDKLWMPNVQFFAQGLDRDKAGETRQIKTLTSNVGLLLHSRLLQDLPVHRKKLYVESIATTICGPEFITVAGVRCRALKHKDMPGFVDYHGTDAVWPKETFNIARGLAEHGFTALARQLDIRILNSVAEAGDFYELFYVEDNGDIWFDHQESTEHFTHKSPAHHLSIPEPGQAWVISAVIHIVMKSNLAPDKPASFENNILKTFPPIQTQITGLA
jgi:glycogen debranching enzyme